MTISPTATEGPQGFISIEISEDKMKAFITVNKPDSLYTDDVVAQEVFKRIEDSGITFGLNSEAVQSILDSKKWGKKTLFAEGSPPIHGEDASYKFSFSTGNSLKPQENKSGNLDYKELNLVQSIDKDAELARKIEATPGVNGSNVLGEELSARASVDIKLANGKGTYRDENNNNIIKAATEGVIVYDPESNKIEVQQVYTIDGDVDFSTGNLRIKSSLKVEGDIKPGFTVETPYDIEVGGVVEHAFIACGGTLKVGSGISGNEKTVINVEGDIHAGYIRDQKVKCCGSIHVANELRNCTVECDDEVNVTSGTGVIIGGHIIAKNGVSALSIGSMNNISTVLEVGLNAKLKEEVEQKTKEKDAMKEVLQDIKERAEKIMEESEAGQKDSRIPALKEEFKIFLAQYNQMKENLQSMEQECYNSPGAKVMVKDVIHPGVLIKIKKSSAKIKDEVSHVVFKLVEGNVVAVPL